MLTLEFNHQYMTNVLAPRSESVKSAQGYSDSNKNNIAFIFRIPVYENMPENVCEIPTGDGSPNNRLSDLYVDGYYDYTLGQEYEDKYYEDWSTR